VAALLLGTALPQPASAEVESDHGAWLMLLGQGTFESAHPRMSRLLWWIDLHGRFFDATDGYGQSIVRPALGWAFTDRVAAHVGYGWIRDSPAAGADRDEHRIFQQLIWKPKIAGIATQSRTRLEQRFVETGNDIGWRLRQFIKLTWPVPGIERLALAAYDEVFFALNDTDWGANAGFDQNRFFVGPQWRFDSKGRVKGEIGYLNRYSRRQGRPDVLDHLVSVNLLTRF
jgi:hypothetical protein